MSLNQHIKGSLDLGNPLMSYTCTVHKPNSNVEYYEAYKNIGRKYTRIAYGTNASMVIQAAIDALGTTGGKIFVKAGSYILNSPLDLLDKENIIIKGEGRDYEKVKGTILKAKNGLNDHMIKIKGTGVYGRQVNITIRDLSLSGNGGNQNAGDAINVDGATLGLHLKNLMIANVYRHAIYMNNIEVSRLQNIFCMGNQATGQSLIYLANSHGNYLEDIEVTGAKGAGIYLYVSSNNTFVDAHTYLNTHNGLYIYNRCKRNTFLSGGSWNNQREGVEINSEGIANIFVGFKAYDNAQDGVARAGFKVRNNVGNPSLNNIFLGCLAYDDQGVKTQDYGYHEAEATDYSLLIGCDFTGNQVGAVGTIVGANTKFKNVLGYVTESSGTATISASTTVTFNHGLAGTPTHVGCGFKTTGYGSWIWSADATNITITVAVSGTYDLTWDAEYKP